MLKSDVNIASLFLKIEQHLEQNQAVLAYLSLKELQDYLYKKYGGLK